MCLRNIQFSKLRTHYAKQGQFHVLRTSKMDTLCCLMGWAGSLIGLSSHKTS